MIMVDFEKEKALSTSRNGVSLCQSDNAGWVILRSSELGVRFPLEWLWATMTAVARSRKGSANTSD